MSDSIFNFTILNLKKNANWDYIFTLEQKLIYNIEKRNNLFFLEQDQKEYNGFFRNEAIAYDKIILNLLENELSEIDNSLENLLLRIPKQGNTDTYMLLVKQALDYCNTYLCLSDLFEDLKNQDKFNIIFDVLQLVRITARILALNAKANELFG